MDRTLNPPSLKQFTAHRVYANAWTQMATERLMLYRRFCVENIQRHQLASRLKQKQYQATQIPIYIVSGIITLLSSYNTNKRELSPWVTAMTVLNSVLVSILGFLAFGEKAASHVNSAKAYKRILRDIDTILYLHPEDRDPPKLVFEVMERELDMICHEDLLLTPENSEHKDTASPKRDSE